MKSMVSSVQCIFAFLIICCLLCYIEAAPTCENLPHEVPENCPYGMTLDWCHRDVCAKGPGESCGGPWMHLGRCAAGMYCSWCDKCTGCATLTLKCHSGEFC